MPAPTAGPFTAATVGSGDRMHAQEPFVDRRDRAALAFVDCSLESAPSAATSAPEQNAGGSPVITTAPTDSSASSASNVATISSTMRRRHRVAAFAVDERHQRDTVVVLDAQVLHQSCRTTAGEWRKKSSTSRS